MNRRIVRKTLNRKMAGFSLLEIMAVTFIIALLAAGVGVGVNNAIKKARLRTAGSQISSFETGIGTFQMECGFYPSALQDLISAPSGRVCKGYPDGGFLTKKTLPQDPWGADYNYTQPGTHNTSGFDLWSNGPDGEDGTGDDVTNWASENTEDAGAAQP